MEIHKIKYNRQYIPANAPTKVIQCGDIIECKSVEYRNRTSRIEKLDSETYRVKSTGEIKRFKKGTSRKDATATLSQTFQNLRNLINCNVTAESVDNVLWVTLTYAENMTDTKRLYNDFRKFNQRLQYYCTANNIPQYEYITVVEPQARGAWHHHLLLIWDCPAPFIPNNTLEEIWKFGFVKVKKLKKGVSNVGVYLTAYLTDVPLEDAQDDDSFPDHVKGLKTLKGKKYVKGGRLHLYPAGIHIYRTSKGIKKPIITRTSWKFAEWELSMKNAVATYGTAYTFKDEESQFSNAVYKTYFSTNRKIVEKFWEKHKQKAIEEYLEERGDYDQYEIENSIYKQHRLPLIIESDWYNFYPECLKLPFLLK